MTNAVFYLGTVIAVAVILTAPALSGSALLTMQPASASTDSLTAQGVAVGGGNMTMPINRFSPAEVGIPAGGNITFYAPQDSTELHNVIFDLSNGSVISSLELPFILPQGVEAEQLALAPPFNLGQPIIQEQPDSGEAIIVLNKLAFYPSVADQQNNTRDLLDEDELQQQMEEAMQQRFFFMSPNLSANYAINGTEKVVSSGIILDVMGFGDLEEEQAVTPLNTTTEASRAGEIENATEATTADGEGDFPPLPYPILNNFTVTFDEPGIYEYFCAFHPAMVGVVTVRGEEGGVLEE